MTIKVISRLQDIDQILMRGFMAIMFLSMTNLLSYLSNCLIFSMFWTRLSFLRNRLQSKCLNKNQQMHEKVHTINKVTYVYKNMLDAVNYNISPINCMGYQKIQVTLFIEAIMGCILMSYSAILAELVLNEYERMKEILAYQLVLCDDEDLHAEILTTLNYLETRPPKYTIYGLFSLDLTLITGIIDICVTYIIILLQFDL
ncbi:uncharacterized protein LOC124532444 [Vanessa cardui]|uniref:uncharacterized protein LOC124532444 n=1 Tax=Vanessa cardui TaxID=171605 RepID=UPI001F12D65D|nr:uncharacterized protein LOC124532444 [Vanessa cardui]